MAGFLGISVWIALVTVIPGLVTIAVLLTAIHLIHPEGMRPYIEGIGAWGDLAWTAVAITVMIVTQAFGILLEDWMVRRRWYGEIEKRITIAAGADPRGASEFTLRPYDEYENLYILLAELREEDDPRGHVERALAQFFLTHNTLVSFLAGILATPVMMALAPSPGGVIRGAVYLAVLVLLLAVSFYVARIRFGVMTKSLWAAKRRRMEELQQ